MTQPSETTWVLPDPHSLNTRHLPECALFHLDDLGLLQVTGADAVSFLQGQLTNDSREISDTQSQLSALCTPKGRMLALFRILGQSGTLLLQLPAALLPGIQKRLQMFVMRSQVRISEDSGNWLQLGLAGACAPALVESLLGQTPGQRDQVVCANGLICLRLGGTPPRFLLLVPATSAQSIQQQLAKEAELAHPNLWKYLSIAAGEPSIYQQTQEAFIPQMLNLEAINGLSFTKGCYTGQEVVARMQYLGKLKRQLYRARVDTDQRPAPGDALFSPESTSGQGAGQVVEIAASPLGGYELLAVIESGLVATSQLHLESISGPEIKLI